MIKTTPQFYGYTFIELLVVISISAVLFLFAIAGYQKYHRSQALGQAASEVKIVLRDVQNRAISGEKDSARCPHPVGAGDPQYFLKEWRFVWATEGLDSYKYKIYGKCYKSDDPSLENDFPLGGKVFILPKTDNIRLINAGTISFKPLTHGMDLSQAPQDANGQASICLQGESSPTTYYKIAVNQSGDINVFPKVASCP